MAQACERYGWNPATALWDVPASLLLMLLRQPGPDRSKAGFGTAERELSETIELPDEYPPFRESRGERVLEGGGPEAGG